MTTEAKQQPEVMTADEMVHLTPQEADLLGRYMVARACVEGELASWELLPSLDEASFKAVDAAVGSAAERILDPDELGLATELLGRAS